METIEINVYKFNELSETVKKKVIDSFINDPNYCNYIFNEAYETVKKFADIFDIDIRQIDFLESYYSDIRFNMIPEVSGMRLAKYIWNNYKNDLFKNKMYWLWSKKEKSYKYYKEGFPVLKQRKSKIFLSNVCVLTGICYDDSVLGPIYDFLNKPDDKTDFEDLMNECFTKICEDVKNEYYANLTESAIAEHCEANGYNFMENGEIY